MTFRFKTDFARDTPMRPPTPSPDPTSTPRFGARLQDSQLQAAAIRFVQGLEMPEDWEEHTPDTLIQSNLLSPELLQSLISARPSNSDPDRDLRSARFRRALSALEDSGRFPSDNDVLRCLWVWDGPVRPNETSFDLVARALRRPVKVPDDDVRYMDYDSARYQARINLVNEVGIRYCFACETLVDWEEWPPERLLGYQDLAFYIRQSFLTILPRRSQENRHLRLDRIASSPEFAENAGLPGFSRRSFLVRLCSVERESTFFPIIMLSTTPCEEAPSTLNDGNSLSKRFDSGMGDSSPFDSSPAEL